MEAWGNDEDLWCRKTCISRFISRYLQPPCSGSGLNQISLRGPFHNVPFNYFTNQGHGTGYCLEDKGINDIIITGYKKRDAIVFAIRAYFSVQKRCQRFDQICLFVMLQRQQRAILQMPLLSIWPLAASILDHCLSAPQRLARWQVYWVIKILRDKSTVAPRDSLAQAPVSAEAGMST